MRFFIHPEQSKRAQRLRLLYLVPLNLVLAVPMIVIVGCIEWAWPTLCMVWSVLRGRP